MQLIHVNKHLLKSKLYKQLTDFKIYIYIIINTSYRFTVYNELAQLIHIGPFTISKQLYITLITNKSDYPELMSPVYVYRRVSYKSTLTASSPWDRNST